MTTFEDGPAQGQRLMLRHTPLYLRVVSLAGVWDALDQPTDSPKPEEKVLAYQTTGPTGWIHLNIARNRGGIYPICAYRLAEPQPAEAEMRNTKLWRQWCEGRPEGQEILAAWKAKQEGKQ